MAIGIICFYLILVLSFWILERGRIYPGVSVAGINLSGKKTEEATEILEQKAADFMNSEIIFEGGEKITLKPADLGLKFNVAATISQAVRYGGKNPFVLGRRVSFPIIFGLEREKTYSQLISLSEELDVPPTNTTLVLKAGEIEITEGTVGRSVNLADTAHNLFLSLGALRSTVPVSLMEVVPNFSGGDVASQLREIKAMASAPLLLEAEGAKYSILPDQILAFVQPTPTTTELDICYGDDYLTKILGKENRSVFSDTKIGQYLGGLAPKINQTAVNAQLQISGGRATVFVASRPGKTLDVAGSSQRIIEALTKMEKSVSLVVNVTPAEVSEGSLNNLGINELLSSGYSNFAGSPKNRIHNIRTGASKFNGVLIKPGEEFSFNKTLGPVDASTGYLPELVILENKTTPQFGGGMCQVSSTAFRAALNAGLPILERLYHAYPVQYYKPYGVDATIYLPKPDLVFKNDTAHYILIQTHIEGTKLTFDFYGTKPTRTVSFAGNGNATGAVPIVEKITPYIYDQGARGKGSFSAMFWRFIYDERGALIKKSSWVSKYDSPDKYPH